jgi:hypothetical protein
VEIEKLISALEDTIAFLQNSESSFWSHTSGAEIIAKLEAEVASARSLESVDTETLKILFAPAGVIQETSIDNGWGKEFLRIAELVDRFTGNDM